MTTGDPRRDTAPASPDNNVANAGPAAGPDVAGRQSRANVRLAAGCLAFVVGMVGMAYAAVPLYDMFCRITGYGGTTQRVDQYSDRVLDRTVTVRFDANVAGALPWEFKPVQREITLRIGETAQVHYVATNLFDTPAAGRATFNVTPNLAGSYFNKVECFCFTDTTLKPGESMDMPVVFYVDPDIVEERDLKNLRTITLSYTFFPTGDESLAAVSGAEDATSRSTDARLGG